MTSHEKRMLVYKFFQLAHTRQLSIMQDFELDTPLVWLTFEETRKLFFTVVFEQDKLCELSSIVTLEHSRQYPSA